jgi:nitroreductase
MEFFSVLTHQRACRSFGPDPVDDALIAKMLSAAVCAPSAENCQPWRFVVVRDDALRASIGDITRWVWEQGGRSYAEARLSKEMLDDVDEGAMGGVAGAPVLIVVCADTEVVHPNALGASVFPAVQNLLLSANALGLGSAMTTLAVVGRAELAALLNLPEPVRPVAVVPIGWPRRSLGPPRRDPFATKTHRDGWGSPW